METRKLTAAEIDELDRLCIQCPRERNTPLCPFKVLGALSRPSRLNVFQEMSVDQRAALFAWATDCICLQHPRAGPAAAER